MAEAELRSLHQRRGAVKARVTRFKNYLGTIADDNELQQLKLRYDKIKPTWDEFEVIQTSIEHLDQDNEQLHIEEREAFENAYFAAMAEAERDIQRCAPAVMPPRHENAPENTAQVKLPTINLPTFSGAYDQWMTFLDTFESLIHDNPNISPIQKFHYLRSALTDEAEQVIHSLEISAASYDIAWDLLKERFDNKRIIVQNHVKALFEIPAITSESYITLRLLLDTTSRHLRALKSLGQPIESWDTILIHILTSKFDQATKREWESVTDAKHLPKMADLNKFLHHRCHMLQSLSLATPHITVKQQRQTQPTGWSRHNDKFAESKKRERSQSHVSTNKPQCPKCGQAHLIYHCQEFTSLTINERNKEVKRLNLCFNCLKNDHQVSQCNSRNCRLCARKHNTLLHESSGGGPAPAQGVVAHPTLLHVSREEGLVPTQGITTQASMFHVSRGEMPVPTQGTVAHATMVHNSSGDVAVPALNTGSHQALPKDGRTVLLSTARLIVYDINDQPHDCRALLDSGSQSSFMSKDLAQRLKLVLDPIHMPVSGIGQSVTSATHVVRTRIKSHLNSFNSQLSFLVLNSITERLPAVHIDRKSLCIPGNLKLADPCFDKPAPIDMLIGAELFWNILCVGQIKSSVNQIVLQKTHFGWVVSGCINPTQQLAFSPSPCFLAVQPDLQQEMQKFWVLEETPPMKYLSPEESRCEAHFVANTKRDIDGRFVVKLPLCSDPRNLGDSRFTAMKRFTNLERKWSRNPGSKNEYVNNLNDYIAKGHMEKVPESEIESPNRPVYYLPHHAVIKEQSVSTKLRVVFDASAPCSKGISLNDLLMVGPTIQDDLLSIIIRFRLHTHVITADIVQMYRQIKVHSDDTDLQRILWRPNQHVSIASYRLNRVTFGTSAAPFLATRCLVQLADDENNTLPDISRIIKGDFYMDDLLTGGSTIAEVTLRKAQISQVLAKGGFVLHKWNSTCPELRDKSLFQLPDSTAMKLTTQEPVKTLGIYWDSINDSFSYRLQSKKSPRGCTKRRILTVIAGIFDPLGLLGPIIVTAKMLMQHIWQLRSGWDEAVSQDVFTQWESFENGLPLLNEIIIPRHVISLAEPYDIHVHGFCDASELAYGACVYIIAVNHQGSSSSRLLCARSKVAPLKTISIPRLELCSALLLARICNKVIKSLKLKPCSTTLWSDSTIALSWILSSPHRWKTFVANRVSEVQSLSTDYRWCHVNSEENPADMLSRGCTALQFIQCNALWWHGPHWLRMNPQDWPTKLINHEDLNDATELRVRTTALISVQNRPEIITRFSTLTKVVNVMAQCLRFKHNCQSPSERIIGPLLVRERRQTLHRLIHLVQLEVFPQEIHQLSQQRQVHSKSRLLALSPFLDGEGILRVGGRLQKAILPETQKHPIILPQRHPLTTLIISYEHVAHLHAGTQGTLAAVRQKYWPLSGRKAAQAIIRGCVACFRVKPAQQTPTMGQLPASRITPARPFSTCGVDFAGPFTLRQGGPRSRTTIKAYMAVFVCFATRATHLELVSSLSSEAFLGCLKRFIGRRGKPSQIFSDNGTNFTGANNELRLLKKRFHEEEYQSRVVHWLADKEIQWNFIPPASPHFGGIWEAAVKSAKRHLLPVMGNASLTYEELTTLLVQVESCLNSRPICPLSADPNDLSVLTPGHFLIGDALSATAEPSLLDITINRLSRWQRIQQLMQHFWSRWSKEYLSQLQQRQKWSKNTPSVTIGSLVLLRDDRTPPLKWPLGRITQVHPGQDGVVRVATVRTVAGSFKRAVAKLCVLPLQSDSSF